MPNIKIIFDGDGAFEDVKDKLTGEAELTRVALLRGGMASGEAAVAFLVEADDGNRYVAQTSVEILTAVARAIKINLGAFPSIPGDT